MADLKKNYWKWRRALWDGPAKEIEPGDFMLLEAIVECFNRAGWPEKYSIANARLMDLTGAAERTLHDRRKRLINKGLISVEKGHKNTAAVYQICVLTAAHRGYSGYNCGDDCGDDCGRPPHNKTTLENEKREAPDLKDVKAYFEEQGLINSDAVLFFEHYHPDGWGKDWNKQARMWEQRERCYKKLNREQALAEIKKEFESNATAATAATVWTNRLYEAGSFLTATEINLIRPTLLRDCESGNDAAARFEHAATLEDLLDAV